MRQTGLMDDSQAHDPRSGKQRGFPAFVLQGTEPWQHQQVAARRQAHRADSVFPTTWSDVYNFTRAGFTLSFGIRDY